MAHIIDLKTFTDDRGNLTVIEKVIPFDIKRIFYIYGVDDSPNIKKLLAETKAIVGTSSQSPTSLGKETIKVAYKMLHHKKYKRSIIVPTKLITKENIEEYDITGWQ